MRELKEVTKRLADKGVVIVSPHHNNHTLSYPASFEWVIGVAIDTHRVRGKEIIITNDIVLNVVDSIKQHQVPWKNNQYVLKTGCSFSCPEVSALACLYIERGAKDYFEVLECLKKDFYCEKGLITMPKEPKFNIKKAVVFPFNKEMHSIVRFYDELSFELVDVYDLKHSLNVGRSTRDVLFDDNIPEFIVKNIDNISWDTFDTLILGCVKELFSVFKDYTSLKKLINTAVQKNKNIYAFENLYDFLNINDLKDRLFYPEVGREQLIPYREGRLAKTSTAIIGIFGTSSKQGKFTLQMELRKELKKQGCKVGQIGSEPSALLFGIDYIFPMGYNSTVYIREEEKILYCNDLIRKLSESCSDIIIVGSQRDTIPKSFENIYQLPTSTYAFLQGTKPDYAIVMISIEDEDNYILRTINFWLLLLKQTQLHLLFFP